MKNKDDDYELKINNDYHEQKGIDEVLFWPDDRWREGMSGIVEVSYYSAIEKEYDEIGKIIRFVGVANGPVYFGYDIKGKHIVDRTGDLQSVIRYYEENGREMKLILDQRAAQARLTEFRRRKAARLHIAPNAKSESHTLNR